MLQLYPMDSVTPGGQAGYSVLPGHTNAWSDPTHNDEPNALAHRHTSGGFFCRYPKATPNSNKHVLRLLPGSFLSSLFVIRLTIPTAPVLVLPAQTVDTHQPLTE